MATTVTILGSGTCVPSLARSSCSVLVSTGNAEIVLDMGAGTMHRLLAAGRTVQRIGHLLLSHFHPDHSGELASFLFANQYPANRRRQTPLTVMGGRGLNRFFDGLKTAWGQWIELPPDRFTLVELDTGREDRRAEDGFVLTTRPTAHNPESLAYRITDDAGASVVYSGDTDECPDLVALARGADLLVCESALPDAMKTPGHLTPSLAGSVAARTGVGHLVLTHLYPECETVDLEAECRRTWDGPLTVAGDLMRFEIVAGRGARRLTSAETTDGTPAE